MAVTLSLGILDDAIHAPPEIFKAAHHNKESAADERGLCVMHCTTSNAVLQEGVIGFRAKSYRLMWLI